MKFKISCSGISTLTGVTVLEDMFDPKNIKYHFQYRHFDNFKEFESYIFERGGYWFHPEKGNKYCHKIQGIFYLSEDQLNN